MPTTPRRAVANMIVHIVVVAIVVVLVVVRQREQEATTCTIVVCVSACPRLTQVTTDQTTVGQLDHSDGRTFVVASTVERGRAIPVLALLVALDPLLIR